MIVICVLREFTFDSWPATGAGLVRDMLPLPKVFESIFQIERGAGGDGRTSGQRDVLRTNAVFDNVAFGAGQLWATDAHGCSPRSHEEHEEQEKGTRRRDKRACWQIYQ